MRGVAGGLDFDRFVAPSETLIRLVEIVAAYLLAGLFAVGVVDLFISITGLVRTGAIFDPDAGIDRILTVIDKALLLFIIVELYQTVVAYTRDESVTRIVIVAGLIAISRKVISFRPGDFADVTELLVNAGAYSVLLLSLVVAYYVVQTTESPGAETESTEFRPGPTPEPTGEESIGEESTTLPDEPDGPRREA